MSLAEYDAFPNGDLLMLKVDNRTALRPTVIVNGPDLLHRRSR